VKHQMLFTKYKIQNTKYRLCGQSLLELLLSIAVGTILIGGSVLLMTTSLRSYQSIKQRLTINSLSRQETEVIISKAQDSWHSVYDLTRATDYYTTSTNNVWSFNSGKEESTINNVSYRRYFQVLDALRDDSGNIATSGNTDPNTLKINVFLEYGINYNSSSSLVFYLTRSSNNQVFQQTDWSEGQGQTGPLPNPGNKFDTSTNINFASTTGSIYMATTTIAAELTSSILDTGVDGGAGFNSLLWQGSKGTNGYVKFQIAFSNSITGPWTYYGCTTIPSSCLNPNNWTTASSSLAALEPNTSLPLPFYSTPSPQNKRYIRYKIFLSTSGTSPQINDIIINWSP